MELTIIETGAYLELKRKLSELSVLMADFQKRQPLRHTRNDWMRRMYALHSAYPKEACKTTGTRD